MSFNSNVFINCPFDKAYIPILNALLFTFIYLKYTPLLSETTSSGDSRISGINSLISKSKYSLHDLSRMQSTKKNEISRFNMPFELGLDFGCKTYGSAEQKTKMLFILDKEKYRYQKAISDLSGNDIGSHGNNPEEAVREVRNWIRKIKAVQIDSANKIWNLYGEFTGDFREEVDALEFNQEDIDNMPKSEYCDFIESWLKSKM